MVMDPRSLQGILSRGKNVYNAGSSAAVSGPQGPDFGRPNRVSVQDPMQAFQGGMPPGQQPPGQTPQQPGQGMGGLPFDPFYSDALLRLQQQEAQLGSDENMSRQRLGEDYTAGFGQLGDLRQQAAQALSNKMASQGLLRSGINLSERGNVENAYQQGVGSLANQQARGLEDISRSFTQGRQGLQDERSQLDQDYIRNILPQIMEQLRVQSETEAIRKQIQSMPQFDPTGRVFPNLPQGESTDIDSVLRRLFGGGA